MITDRLLLWLPAGLGGLVALLVLGLGAVPLHTELQLLSAQLARRQVLAQRLPQIRSELSGLAGDQLQAEQQQQQVLTLIAGSGELATFMAQVDRLAQRHRVQLQLFEPISAETRAVDPISGQRSAKPSPRAPATPPDPLQRAGLSSSRLLLSARGAFPDLLAFMRSIESLSLLVVPSNLKLSQVPAATAAAGAPAGASSGKAANQPAAPQGVATAPPAATGLVELRLALALYRPAARR